eukprot:Rmarinus@m.20661
MCISTSTLCLSQLRSLLRSVHPTLSSSWSQAPLRQEARSTSGYSRVLAATSTFQLDLVARQRTETSELWSTILLVRSTTLFLLVETLVSTMMLYTFRRLSGISVSTPS